MSEAGINGERLIEHQLLLAMRQATLILLIDQLLLQRPLLSGVRDNGDSSTVSRVLRAGAALGLLEHDGDATRWVGAYHKLAIYDESWRRLVHIVQHQTTYLRLARSHDRAAPSEQSSADPVGYLDFLRGVDASHRAHADWMAALEPLRGARHLCDLGGGLGTFSRTWVASRPDRTAVLADLPEVVELIPNELTSPQIRLRALDLRFDEVIEDADVYLFANVLPLLPDWQHILRRVVGRIRGGALVAVFEATPLGPSGAIFDLQVHLRGGYRGGLITGPELDEAMGSCGLSLADPLVMVDPDDPFGRRYELRIGRRD